MTINTFWVTNWKTDMSPLFLGNRIYSRTLAKDPGKGGEKSFTILHLAEIIWHVEHTHYAFLWKTSFHGQGIWSVKGVGRWLNWSRNFSEPWLCNFLTLKPLASYIIALTFTFPKGKMGWERLSQATARGWYEGQMREQMSKGFLNHKALANVSC